MNSHSSAKPIMRARLSLEGLSVGDVYGEQAFNLRRLQAQIVTQNIPSGAWRYTDDTNMALSIYELLRLDGAIDQDKLAKSFARHFDPSRGYGHGARRLLMEIQNGGDWRVLARQMFGGQGSYGNGAAMRIAPLGAYFADDLDKVVEQARLSSEVTHAHPEGIAGGIAVAVAAAVAWRSAGNDAPNRAAFIDQVIPYVPESEVRSKLNRARDMGSNTSLDGVISQLGNGSEISAQDTVPFCLWAAGEFLSNYERALVTTAHARGDIDTNCAIVGGIVAVYTGIDAIPMLWRGAREPLPAWIDQPSA